ncbi:MAG: hypothetical protein GVY23_01395 [Spirochaetes bacterium]|jgi:hypothetical protein|nr:hypothetical protein [Spirochaetota bacterium]
MMSSARKGRWGTLRLATLILVVTGVAVIAVAGCRNPTSSGTSAGGTDTTDPPPTDAPEEPEPEPEPAPGASIRGGIVVNEFLPDPTGDTDVDTDANGEAGTTDEFVELYNIGPETVDISGLELWDPSSGNWFTFPDATLVDPAGTALVVIGVDDGGSLPTVPSGSVGFDAGSGRGILNNAGDNLILLDRNAGAYLQLLYNGDAAIAPETELESDGFPTDATLVDVVDEWGSDTDGSSLARDPDGTGSPEPHVEFGAPASPGFLNAP